MAISKQPSTRNIKLQRATIRSLVVGRNPSLEPRIQYVSGRRRTSTTNVDIEVNGVTKLAYSIY